MESEFEAITIPNLTKFVTDCFVAANVPLKHSQAMAATIVEADIMGYSCHGLFMLENCILDVKSGVIDTSATPKIDKESSAVAWVDGKNALGPIVADFSVKLAIQKAKNVGASIVVAKHSNSFGAGARYSKLVLDEGLLGWTCSNCEPSMVPCRAKYAIIGANLLSFGAPALFGDYFLFDMATSLKSPNSIGIKGCKGEFLPPGFAINAAALPETNSDVAARTKYLLPLGSEEARGSYKGTGLSLMFDILCGVLGGSYYGSEVGIVRTQYWKKKAHISHCFIVIDPKRFAPEFEVRLSELINHLRTLNPTDPAKPVRVAGDMSKMVTNKATDCGVLHYPKFVIESVKNVAKMLKVKCVEFVAKPKAITLTVSQELTLRLELEQKAENLKKEEEVEGAVSEYLMEAEIAQKLSIYSAYEPDEDSNDWMLA